MARRARHRQPGCKKDQRIVAGWYDPTDGVHYPYDVLIAQEQNLGWDARLRRRYAALILAAAVICSVLGLITGILIAGGGACLQMILIATGMNIAHAA